MIQQDLFGFSVPYECKTCGKGFQTMKDSSQHHATKHKRHLKKQTSINFALENYCLISTKVQIIEQ